LHFRYSDLGYNLACILTFPSAQRQGYGRFLIAFSYELTKKEEKVGAPEKPLSDLGAISYKSYWASTILLVLKSFPGSQLSVMDLAKMTSLIAEDTVATLQHLGLLQLTKSGNYVICAPIDVVDALMIKYPIKGPQVDPECLNWAPLYVMDYKKDKWAIKGKRDSDGPE
jgi:histone acetyltransferase MYST1